MLTALPPVRFQCAACGWVTRYASTLADARDRHFYGVAPELCPIPTVTARED